MLVYYFVPFIVSNHYLLFWVSNGHNSVTVQNRTHVYMNFFYHKDLGNHLLQLCPKVVKHPVLLYLWQQLVFYIWITKYSWNYLFVFALYCRYGKQSCFNVVKRYFMSMVYKWINTYTYFKSFYGAVVCVEHRKRCIYGERMGNCEKTMALFLWMCHLGIRLGVMKKLQYDRRIYFYSHQI